MSNLLNNQIGQALTNVSNALEQQELTEFNTLRVAKLSLYHAHSITSKSAGELTEHLAQSQKAAVQSRIASLGVNATANIAVAAKAAVMDASTTTSNAAAAAASVQKAATALTGLAGNIATTLAVANTLDKGSKIQSLVEKATKATNDAAKMAEEASLIALNLTIEASQSRAASVVTQADDVKSKMSTLQKALSDTFGKQMELITKDEAASSSAIAEETQQAGIYKTARAEEQALRLSASFINQYINNNLAITIHEFGKQDDAALSGDTFTLSFSPLKETEAGIKKISEHRIIIVKADDAVAFNIESAKGTSARNYSHPYAINGVQQQSYFLANVSGEINDDNDKSLLLALRVPHKPILAVDYTGQPVVRGTPYKFFVYAVYTTEYQNEYNDTNGYLTLPSETFTLRTPLPVVSGTDVALAFYQKKGADAMRMIFRIPSKVMELSNGTDLNELMEFRTLIFNQLDQMAFARNKTIDQQANQVFQADDDFRLKEETYLQAKAAYDVGISQESPKYVIDQLKMELDIAKAQYQAAKANYNNQEIIFDRWNQSKISDFTFDVDIAQGIPASNYAVATLVPHLPEVLTRTAFQLSEQVDSFNESIENSKNRQAKLQKEYAQLEKDIEESAKRENPLPAKIQGIQDEIKKLILQLEATLHEKISIKTEEDAEAFKNHLNSEQQAQMSLLDKIIANFQQLKELESKELDLSKNINDWRSKQKKISTEIVLLTAELGMLQDELNMLSTEKAAFDTLSNQFSDSDHAGYSYYEVVNEDGDFTDNFGEPLVTGNTYCAAVLSVIKSTEPDAAPLFQSTLSDFSGATAFQLTQI
ncbi:MAG: hypothetical protein HOP30_15255 [Cyclobacteriaceae bacterium]|nr:hypothetical protein [Cyclobacteriaceae bacterium]